MNIWLTLILAGALTFAIRLSFIWWVGRGTLPRWVPRALRFVPPAVLTAIIFPAVFLSPDQGTFTLQNPRLLAGLLAALIAWRTSNAVLTIGAGMALLWLFMALGW